MGAGEMDGGAFELEVVGPGTCLLHIQILEQQPRLDHATRVDGLLAAACQHQSPP